MLSNSGSHATPVASSTLSAPAGLYNKTVQCGDRLSLPIGMLVLIVGGLFTLLYSLDLLSG